MNVSRVKITRDHLKKITRVHKYDGVRKYRQTKSNPELDGLIAMVMYDIYYNIVKTDEQEK